MMSAPKITFIGAGSTIFVKNILGDVFHRGALKTAHIALMDIDPTRREESHIVVRKLMDSAGASGKITCHTQQKEALQDADFVVVAFQIGGYEPCTVTDFEVCKRHGLEQTIADTLQGFRGDVGWHSYMHIVDSSPGMSHTRGFRYSAGFV